MKPTSPLKSASPLKPTSPSPAVIRTYRTHAHLSQTEAADLVCSTRQRWADWEAGTHKMHPGLWKLFICEIGQKKAK